VRFHNERLSLFSYQIVVVLAGFVKSHRGKIGN